MLFIMYHERATKPKYEADPKPILCNNMSKFDFATRTTTQQMAVITTIV